MSVKKNKIERRNFLKYLGAVALGSGFKNLLTIKKRNVEHLIPFVIPPKGVIPGVPNWYASVCRQCSSGCGISVKTRELRAIKVEGNDNHPVNKGKVCVRGQAGLQVLYNPDRVKNPMMRINGKLQKTTWSKAINHVADKLKAADKDKVIYLGEPQRGSLGILINDFFSKFGVNNVYYHDYFDDKASESANNKSFGYNATKDYDIGNAKYVISLGANFLQNGANPVKHSVSFGEMRDRNSGNEDHRGWLTQFEPRMTITGATADDWHPIKPHTEGLIALAIANIIVEKGWYDKAVEGEIKGWEDTLAKYDAQSIAKKAGVTALVLEEVAEKFAHSGSSIAICGGSGTAQESGVFNATAANILNHLVGSVGKKGGVRFPAPSDLGVATQVMNYKQMKDLSKKMGDGNIDVAFIHNADPVFTAPAGLNLENSFRNVALKVSFSSFLDDTSRLADVILPDSTYLESWGDYVPLVDNGNKSIGLMQPIVGRLFNTKMVGDSLLKISKAVGHNIGEPNNSSFKAYLKNSWKSIHAAAKQNGQPVEGSFGDFWNSSIKRGGFWYNNENFVSVAKTPKPAELTSPPDTDKSSSEEFVLQPYPSAGPYDGRGANQPWLQQLPEPLVTAAWKTWAEINPETAKELHIEEGDNIEILSDKGRITLPAYIYPAIEPKTIAVPVGRGHKAYGRYAKGFGKNILKIIDPILIAEADSLAWGATKVKVSKGKGSEKIIKTEPGKLIPSDEIGLREQEREIVQWMDPEEYEKVKHRKEHRIEAIIPTRNKEDMEYRWGMTIDLDKCTGCSACMVACYAENNIALVNDDQLSKNRHKNWLRIDRYWEGEYPKIRAKVLPANCQQCGKASCEPVCPVFAAFSTKDGLNGQVYQRCVGTRYCNVACPYRVRLFNWSQPEWPKPLNMQLNPDLSSRAAGVTEKCTFCVQRIRFAKDKAKDEYRKVKDGEVQPACMQTCPSNAIAFGNLLDKNSKVSKLSTDPRRYRVLEELDTEPAVIYLKSVRKGAVEHKKKESGGGH